MAFNNRAQVFAGFALGLLLMAYGAEAAELCECRSRLYSEGCTNYERCAEACRQERTSGGFCSGGKYRGRFLCICAGYCDARPEPKVPESPLPPECSSHAKVMPATGA